MKASGTIIIMAIIIVILIIALVFLLATKFHIETVGDALDTGSRVIREIPLNFS